MLHTPNPKTPDRIIETLLEEPTTARELQNILRAQGLNLSTSGLYKALDRLQAADVVIRSRGIFSINTEWRKNVSDLLGTYAGLELKEGESVAFEVGSAAQMDKLWKHYAFLLEHESKRTGLFCYNPHEFWIHIPDRRKSEEDFFAYVKRHKIPMFYTIGYPTTLDKSFARTYGGGAFQINFEKVSFFSDLDNTSVFGDYVLNGKIDEKLFESVHKAYRESKDHTELAHRVAQALAQPHRYKFKLERNAKKALRLRKRLSKHFVIPNEIKT